MSKICQYCGSEKEVDKKRCAGCDAASFGDQPAQRHYSGGQFFYNGYVVVWRTEDIESFMHQSVEHVFYLGDRLLERIIVDCDVLRRFVPEGQDIMPFIWDLFKLAQGEEEVLRITEQNTIKPTIFEITAKPSLKQEWAVGLTRTDIYKAIEEGRRELTYRA